MACSTFSHPKKCCIYQLVVQINVIKDIFTCRHFPGMALLTSEHILSSSGKLLKQRMENLCSPLFAQLFFASFFLEKTQVTEG